MVTEVRVSRAVEEEWSREVPVCTGEGERPGLYGIIADMGPVTAFGLAFQAMIPVALAQRWLAAQVQGGYVVRDVATGRYRTWCVVSEDEGAGR